MELGISGKRALVVGASRGLGASIAAELAGEGVHVIASSRDPARIEAWLPKLDAQIRERISPRRLDLSSIESVDQLASDLLAEGGVDILVNNSGGPQPSTALTSPRAVWISDFEAMAANVIHLSQRLLPPMLECGWGRIITIGSSGIVQPIASLANSNGIRAALAGWSKTLATEVADRGVTVNMVLPGRIGTERVAQLDAATAQRANLSLDEVRDRSRASIPAGRYGTPDEFAAVVTFLASARASYVTGSNVRVDGGIIRSV